MRPAADWAYVSGNNGCTKIYLTFVAFKPTIKNRHKFVPTGTTTKTLQG